MEVLEWLNSCTGIIFCVDCAQAEAWFPYGRKCVVTVVEIGLQSISTIVTKRLRHV